MILILWKHSTRDDENAKLIRQSNQQLSNEFRIRIIDEATRL